MIFDLLTYPREIRCLATTPLESDHAVLSSVLDVIRRTVICPALGIYLGTPVRLHSRVVWDAADADHIRPVHKYFRILSIVFFLIDNR